MNYRHIFHAGNFADVFKHSILILLVQSLCKKETAFAYLDTHAGIGRYDLISANAKKSPEYLNGIGRCYTVKQGPAVIKVYQKIIREFNGKDARRKFDFPHFYPGSPRIVRPLLRQQDRMILVELHAEDIATLKQEFYRDKQVLIHHQDGYQAIKAFLPFKENRGLTLIDPPFEKQDEFNNIIKALHVAEAKFPNGIYAVWYPIKEIRKINWFYQQLKKLSFSNVLMTEFQMPNEKTPQGLNRCGMIIVNAPWQFEIELDQLLSWLSPALFSGKEKQYVVKWIVQSR